MGILEEQHLKSEVSNRKLGRRRLRDRARRRAESGWGIPVVQLERRRPDRGEGEDTSTQRAPSLRRSHAAGRGIGDGLVFLGRLGLIALAFPFQLLYLLSQPGAIGERTREAPARLRALGRRLRMDAKDPGTRAGRAWETLRLSTWFLREEVADMQDGFPTTEEIGRDLRDGSMKLLTQTGEFLGVASPDDPKAGPERLFHAAAIGLLAGTIAVGLFVAGYAGFEQIKTSERLALRSVEIYGAERSGIEAVRSRLDIPSGVSLIAIDLPSSVGSAVDLPWVDSVRVERDLRDQRLLVRVVEHNAVLLLAAGPLRLVDEQGRAFKRLEAGDPSDLPILTGLTSADTDPDSDSLEQATAGALHILHALSGGRALSRAEVSEIRYEGEDGFVLITRGGLPIRLGREDFAARLNRLERAVGSGGLPLGALASLDLGLRDRLVAVPRGNPPARKQLRRSITEQAVHTETRSRMLHLERIRRSLGADISSAILQ